MKIHSLLTSLLFLFVSSTHTFADEIDVTQDLRIFDLFPRGHFMAPPPIDPAVPENFVALDVEGKPDICYGVHWGPKEVLEEYFRSKKAPSEPILFVKLASATQPEPGKIDIHEFQSALKEHKKLSYKEGKWGDLPYVLVQGEFEGEKLNIVFVGDNSDGNIFLFRLIYPEDNQLEGAALKLWDKFIKETKQLPFPLMLKCFNREMHHGYTIYDSAGKKLSFRAELDEEKKLLQVSVEPHEEDIGFRLLDVETCIMGASWHQYEKMAKIKGWIKIDNGTVNVYTTTLVLIKKTKAFSKPAKNSVFHRVIQLED